MAEEPDELLHRVESALPPHVGACVLAIDRGTVIFEHGFGVSDVVTGTPCAPDTNFRLASVSKQFTAAAILLLVDRGQLSLDDTLDKFFPGFPEYGRKISVQHLLVHTSGLPHYEERIPSGTTLQLDDLDVLHILMDATEPRFAAGARFEYSNSGYTLLGLIVEIAAGQPFHDFMQQEIFRPLDMNDTVLFQRGLNAVPRRAYGHEKSSGGWMRADQSLTSAIRGDGGVYSSLDDYRKWLAALDAQSTPLSTKSLAAMFSPHVVSDRDGSRYGYGWFIDEYRGEPRIHHNGDTHGFRACIQRFPRRQAAVFIQINNIVDDQATPMSKVGQHVADLLIFDRKR
jgi:CubicO group peptidase (beta-lactamase class C family)